VGAQEDALRLGADTILDSGLGGRQASHGHAVRAARDVVEADAVAELDGVGLAGVLTADAKVDARVGGAGQADAKLHQLAYTCQRGDRGRQVQRERGRCDMR